jgi:alkanesulfonate monooxygenase SsuD/methylene tetrahydromethanopterin reductase-like flavin-dependent oxidoreductase (luciferase family)
LASLTPAAERSRELLELASLAAALGLEYLGIQNHPYQRRFLDTWTLLAVVATRTEWNRVFPDVANLPLRPPAVMAKAAASLDRLSGGRFELGIGAGCFWEAVEAMGGERRSPGESVEALAEAIELIRLCWSGEHSVWLAGQHYRVRGYKPGPPQAHKIEIWIVAYRPRMLRLTGRMAGGWVPSYGHLTPREASEAARLIDEAAERAGRDPPRLQRRRAHHRRGAGQGRARRAAAALGRAPCGLACRPRLRHVLSSGRARRSPSRWSCSPPRSSRRCGSPSALPSRSGQG